ncbi:MAG TPA: Flp pilus assembly protein CpaB [Rhizomicrobium sp.]|nr:Flp pilus assembly protein CpaB [Rhizomicrobium sp.]
MGLTFSHATLERPAVILPVALLLLAAAGGVMWSNQIAREDARLLHVPAPAATSLTIAMLVSASDIPRGRVLNAQDVSVQMVAPAKAPAAALHRAEDAQGHMALAPIAAGAPILSDQISAETVAGLSARVPQSYRAYSIPVSEADIAGGFVQANDHVDLYVTLPGALFAEGQKAGDRSKATLLLQSAQVLAVGAKLKNDGSPTPGVRTVTLALSTGDLAKVALAARLGSISFAIRNPLDDTAGPGSGAELSSLLGGAPAAAAGAPHQATRKPSAGQSPAGIPFYSGRERTTLRLP